MIQIATFTPDEAAALILSGTAPDNLVVQGDLDLSMQQTLTSLPSGLQVRNLTLDNCSALTELPASLQCYQLKAANTPLKSLPVDIQVTYQINLSNCTQLESLPTGLKTGGLNLHNCSALKTLPENFDVFFLTISACTAMTAFPQRGPATLGRLNMRGCTQLNALPPGSRQLRSLISATVPISRSCQITSKCAPGWTWLKRHWRHYQKVSSISSYAGTTFVSPNVSHSCPKPSPLKRYLRNRM